MLKARLIDYHSEQNPQPVDFRVLTIRDFGTVHEELMQTKLCVAHENLTTRKVNGQEMHLPAEPGDKIAVPQGDMYLRNQSTARKSTGSYFTKPFAVEHLLDEALEPALDAHIQRLEHLRKNSDHDELSETFYVFRCADIAMGTAHFLVAAVDRIAAKLSGYLAQHPVASVSDELARLRKKATEALGEQAEDTKISDDALLRRLVARRCVYGIDINPIAVELARFAVWAHTFVPGLPLSFLDHNLVCGDSLTGVSALSEAIAAVATEAAHEHPSLFMGSPKENLAAAGPVLRQLARTQGDIERDRRRAQRASLGYRQTLRVCRALLDIVSVSRAGDINLPEMTRKGLLVDDAEILRARSTEAAQASIAKLMPVHYPLAFPEVFLRDNPGFDCIIGNPPWEKAVTDKKEWWGRHLPCIRGLPVGEMNAAVDELRDRRPDLEAEFREALASTKRRRRLLRAAYPKLGAGTTDIYKAFCWREWDLLRHGGTLGVVLPRSVLQSKGSEQWLKEVLSEGAFLNVTTLINRGGWVFDDVSGNYTIALLAAQKLDSPGGAFAIHGPYASLLGYRKGRKSEPQPIDIAEFLNWSNKASFPQLPEHPEALTLFRKLRKHPRFEAQRITGGAELPTCSGRQQRHHGQTPVHPQRGGSDRTANSTARTTNICSFSAGGVRPVAELHSTADKHLFILGCTAREKIWPVYKGASFNLWQPDTGTYYASVDAATITGHLHKKRQRQAKTKSSAFYAFPPEIIDNPQTLPCLQPRIAFRDITRSTDSRTVITSLVPADRVLSSEAPYLLRRAGTPTGEAYLLGVLSSMVLDWYARRVVDLHLTFYLLNDFPIPAADPDSDPLAGRVARIAGRLAAVDDRFAEWANEVGVPVGSANDPDTKQGLIHQLDACVARLYGLDENDLDVLYATFDENRPDRYNTRREAVLEHFRKL